MSIRLNRRTLAFLVLACLALAFVGSAVAREKGSSAAPVYQQRCATGAVKAIVVVTGNAHAGISGLPDSYTSDPSVFGVRWSCVANTTYQVRRVDRGIYDLKLNGNSAGTAIVNAFGDARGVGVIRMPDGAFRVTLSGLRGTSSQYGTEDNAFILVAL